MSRPTSRAPRLNRCVRAACQTLERRMLLSLSPSGSEFHVNTFTTNIQSEPAIAMDGDGDFVVVWQSFSQEPSYGIYAQRYNAAGVAQGSEFKINDFFTNGQSTPAVAMDADGDFVVAWRSYFQDGSGYAVMARRYNAAGVQQGNEFRVNSYTTNGQISPSVAMDPAGNFVIAWSSVGQDGSSDGVYAQRYNFAGIPQGAEFRVNTYTTMIQARPSVAMDAGGNFVIAWESQGQDGAGYGVYAKRFTAAGVVQGSEFRVHSFTTGRQSDAAVAMDLSGDFVIAWDSSGQDGSSEGVYAQRYNAAGVAQGGEFRVNTHTTQSQFFPTVAVDADGDFLVAWQSYLQDGALSGVYAQQYNAAGAPIGGEFRINTFTAGEQGLPAVAADHKGDYVVSWASNGQDGSSYGVYAQRYQESVDTAAPIVAEVLLNDERVLPYKTYQPSLQQIIVSVSENLTVAGGSTGANSVTNPANWLLTRNGLDLTSDISSITFGFNATTNRHEAVLNLTTGHTSGNFLLQARDTLRDAAGNALDGNFDGAPGGSFALSFSLSTTQPAGGEFRVNSHIDFAQNGPSLAMDADGDFVVAWQSLYQDGEGYGIYAQRYNAAGVAQGSEFRVNGFATASQRNASVAMNSAGDFVVAWESAIQDGNSLGVFARRYNAAGAALSGEFQVNTYTTNSQRRPSAAMNATGDFVVAWESDAQDGSSGGIYAQRYNAAGLAQGAEFRVNSYTTSSQFRPSVAMDAAGNFVVAWQSLFQAGDGYEIYAQRYNAAGVAQGSEFAVNSFTTLTQRYASVAMNPAGDFVVTWDSYLQDGSEDGIYAQRYDSAGIAQGAEFRVNSFTTGDQSESSVAMSAAGDFVVTWGGSGPNDSIGVQARRYTSAGIALGTEFRVNSYTTGAQFAPCVAMDGAGEFAVAWTSYDQDGSSYGVYAQRYGLNPTPVVGSLTDSPDPVAAGSPLTLTANNVTDDGIVTSVSFYRESNGVAGLQVGFEGDTLVGTDTDGSDGWSAGISTTGLGGTYTYWAQATDDANLIGTPASTTNTVTLAAPAVTASNFNFATLPQRLSFTFNQNVGPSLDLSDITVQQLPAGPTVTPDAVSFDTATNTATFTFSSAIPDGRYRARLIASGISGPGGQLPADHTFEFTFLRGDANGDGTVNLSDFNVLAANFGQSPRDFTQGDFDYSGVVNLADFNLLASRFGQVFGAASAGGSTPIGGATRESEDETEDLLA